MSTYSIRAINGLSLFLPPETICYYHDHLGWAHQTADMDTHLRVTLFATPIFVGFGGQAADRSTEYCRKVRRYIELNKTFCRRVMANQPVVYHHTPDIGLFKPADWCVLEYAVKDHSCGYAGIFKLSGGKGEYIFRPAGIDPQQNYNITQDNEGQSCCVPGYELMNTGVRIPLDNALTSELVLYSVKNTKS